MRTPDPLLRPGHQGKFEGAGMPDTKLLIIGIHGLANKPPKAQLEDWWRRSIVEGLDKNCDLPDPEFDFQMVYWADTLYSSPLHTNPAFSFDNLYNEEPYAAAEDGSLKEYADGWRDEARRITLGAGGSVLDLIKSNLSVNFVANWVLEKTLKDLDFYYDENRKLRDPVTHEMEHARAVLMGVLDRELESARGRPTLLIGHSMGSIIAYDVLRDLGERADAFDIDHFVTIGSPLGLPHVKINVDQERKHRPGAALRSPTVVAKSWTNFADRADPVALDAHLSDDYEENARGIVVGDDLVSNDYAKPGDPEDRNHHKSYGYLRTPELSRLIAALIK